ncbi:phage tail protein [Pantoea vagans]|uniref:phage tail-collar fiber domain-containing protein n=1 Tax=Pantoea vagans TaxID=470934 RepID=UPI0022596853|nr:phage tail protein [Pantoea vagans]MCX3308047.1 phage tail protein [Pantoea vagans]
MSQTVITTAFEQWKARQAETGEPVLLDGFIFANVPGLDPAKPVDRSEGIPPEAQIVHRQAVTRKGVVNQNAVVHSVVLGADTGDFTFNWIGLVNSATGTLAMIVHAPAQQKLKTREGQQGNVLTRSFLMEYSGAQQETGISTPAETWQIDFTARMGAMDERQRLENTDIYGPAAFFGDGWLVGKSGTQFFVSRGAGYVGGLRAQLDADQKITVGVKPVKVWLDVCFTGTLASVWGVQSKITVAADLADYELDGVKHYVSALAGIDAAGNITDLRPKGSLNEQASSNALAAHEKSRNHPDATLEEKGFVKLFSGTASDSEKLAATPKAVKAAMDNANGRYSQKGGVLDGSLEAKGDVLAVSANVVARAEPGNTYGGAFFFQKIKDGNVVNTGSLMSEFNGGHIQINPSSLDCFIRLNGKAVSGQPDNYRIVSSNGRAQFWRFDGSNFYLMFTKPGDPYGSWNDLRPLSVNHDTGQVTFANGVTIQSNLIISWGGNGHVYQENGDIVERGGTNSIFRGYWNNINLNGALRAITTHADNANNRANDAWNKANDAQLNRVSDVALGGEGAFLIVKNGQQRVPGGCVMTGWNYEGDNPGGDTVFYRPIQKYYPSIGWVNVGHTA